MQAVVDKGLNSYASSRILTPDAPVIEPKYFIWVIQKKDGCIMERRDQEYGEDQNLGLHDLVSQPSTRRIDTSQRLTVDRHTGLVSLDAGYCPFCSYHIGCHKILNTHIRSHLWLSIFCGVRDCFSILTPGKPGLQVNH